MAFFGGAGNVLDTTWHDKHLALMGRDFAIAHADLQDALDDDKYFVRIGVAVPDEIALQLDQLELIIVHFGHHTWRPLLRDVRQLFREVDDVRSHVPAPSPPPRPASPHPRRARCWATVSFPGDTTACARPSR